MTTHGTGCGRPKDGSLSRSVPKVICKQKEAQPPVIERPYSHLSKRPAGSRRLGQR